VFEPAPVVVVEMEGVKIQAGAFPPPPAPPPPPPPDTEELLLPPPQPGVPNKLARINNRNISRPRRPWGDSFFLIVSVIPSSTKARLIP
jgi:hypothetical protein